MKKQTFLEQLKKHENQWVALREPEKEVVASGKDASETMRQAEKRGYKNVILLHVLPFRGSYVPHA